MLNITKPEKAVYTFNLNKLLYDNDIELCGIHTIHIENSVGNRLERIKELIRIEHMNNEVSLYLSHANSILKYFM